MLVHQVRLNSSIEKIKLNKVQVHHLQEKD